MIYSRNLICFFNILLSLFFFNIHFINGVDNVIQVTYNSDVNNNNNNGKRMTKEEKNNTNEEEIEEENENENEDNNINTSEKINQGNYQNHIKGNNTNYKNVLLNNRTEDKNRCIGKKEPNNNKSKNKNSIKHNKKINFTITFLANKKILDNIKINDIETNEEGHFILDFKNCTEGQLVKYINQIKNIINEEKGSIKETEGEEKYEEEEKEETKETKETKNNENNPTELKVEEVGVRLEKKQNEEEEEENEEEVEQDETDKKEPKNKNKKEIKYKDEMETNTQKKDIKYEVLLIRNLSSDKNEELKNYKIIYDNIEEGKNNKNIESLVKYICSNDDRGENEKYYQFNIQNGDRLIIEIYDDKFKEKIDEYYERLVGKFSKIRISIIQAEKDMTKEKYNDINVHINHIENITDFISNPIAGYNHVDNKLLALLYHKYKVIKEICDFFDNKLNKWDYSQCNKNIENKIKKNYINKYSTAIFNIEDDIKNFIDSISIFKLPKKICNEEDNTEEEDSFQLNKRIEQHNSKNGPCDSCKRRVYINK